MIRRLTGLLLATAILTSAGAAMAQPNAGPTPGPAPADTQQQNVAAQALSEAVRDTIAENVMQLVNARARVTKCEADVRMLSERLAAATKAGTPPAHGSKDGK